MKRSTTLKARVLFNTLFVLTATLCSASCREAKQLETLSRKWAAMTDEIHDIRRLPPPVQARLRSTQILTSLPQIVSELVQNALDANASTIDIGLDCGEWTVWVRDDGAGISKDGLESLAEEGSRYSACYTLPPRPVGKKPKVTMAFRHIEDLCTRVPELSVNLRLSWRRCTANRPRNYGRWLIWACDCPSPTALASAADISCLEICSRTAISRSTWSVIMKVIYSCSFQ